MPALDSCHPHIVHALEKDGWLVSERSPSVSHEGRTVFIDIFAARANNGHSQQVLLVEVKCFPDRESTTRDLYTALGQYLIYRSLLAERDIDTPLYLALPQSAYDEIFDVTVQRAIRDNRINMVIVHLDTEVIVRWINWENSPKL